MKTILFLLTVPVLAQMTVYDCTQPAVSGKPQCVSDGGVSVDVYLNGRKPIQPATSYTSFSENFASPWTPAAWPEGTAPAIGAAGSYITDTTIPSANRIMRVSDTSEGTHSFGVAADGGTNAWAYDNSAALYYDLDTMGCKVALFDLSKWPNTGTIKEKRALSFSGCNFSWVNPDSVYGAANGKVQRYSVSKQTYTDVATWPAGPSGQFYWDSTLRISGDDRYLCAYSVTPSGQDTGTSVACYDQIKASWWTRSIAPSHVHSIAWGASTQWLQIAPIDGPAFWINPDSGQTYSETTDCPPPGCAVNGHHAEAQSVIVRGHQPSCSGTNVFMLKPISGLDDSTKWTMLHPCGQNNWDQENHLGWANAATDQTPVFVQMHLKYTHSTPKWLDNEIVAFSTGAERRVWHFAHTFGRIASSCLDWQASPHPSRDGKWVLFTTDWQGKLGAGSGSCSARTDVFLLEAR